MQKTAGVLLILLQCIAIIYHKVQHFWKFYIWYFVVLAFTAITFLVLSQKYYILTNHGKVQNLNIIKYGHMFLQTYCNIWWDSNKCFNFDFKSMNRKYYIKLMVIITNTTTVKRKIINYRSIQYTINWTFQ